MRRDLLFLTGAQGVAFLYPLILTPHLIAMLGVNGFGSTMIVVSLALYLGLIVDFGFNMTGVRDAALCAGDRVAVSQVAGTVLTAKLWLYAPVVLCGLALAASDLLAMSRSMVAVSILCLFGNVVYPGWLIQGLGRLRLLASITAGSRLILVVLGLVLVRDADGAIVAAVCLLGANAVSALLGWPILIVCLKIVPSPAKRTHVWAAARRSAPAFFSALSSGIMTTINPVVVGQISGVAQAAYFSGANRVLQSSRTAFTPLQAAILPRLSRAFGSDLKTARSESVRAGWVMILPHTVGGGLLALASAWIVPWYLGPSMEPAVSVLRVMGLSMFVAGVETWAYSVHIACGTTSRALAGYVMAAILHLALLVPATLTWGATGAAGAMAVSGVVLALLLSRGLPR